MASFGLFLFSGQTPAGAANPMPRIVASDGRYALLVDGAPFFMLGAQCHNSSAWPATLPKVWAAIDDLHANTLEFRSIGNNSSRSRASSTPRLLI